MSDCAVCAEVIHYVIRSILNSITLSKGNNKAQILAGQLSIY